MLALFRLFFSISILKKGPQHVPHSGLLLVLLLLVSLVLDLLLVPAAATEETQQQSKTIFAFIFTVYIVFYTMSIGLLLLHGYSNRILKTLTAQTGIELIIKLVQLPLLFILKSEANTGLIILAYYLFMITIGWWLTANMHIFREALSISTLRAVLITAIFFISSLLLEAYFFAGTQ